MGLRALFFCLIPSFLGSFLLNAKKTPYEEAINGSKSAEKGLISANLARKHLPNICPQANNGLLLRTEELGKAKNNYMGTIKIHNKKLLSTLLIGLSAASFLGVGFAAWTITQSATGVAESGITADATVTTNAISLEATGLATQPIVFGPKNTDSSGWLATSGDSLEQLSATFSWDIVFTTSTKDARIYFDDLVLALTGATDNYTNNEDLIEGSTNLLGTLPKFVAMAPTPSSYSGSYSGTHCTGNYYSEGFFTVTVATASGSDGTFATGLTAVSGEDHENDYYCTITNATTKETYVNKATITINIQFAWGSHFNHKNPQAYYNDQSLTSELAADANTSLSKLKEINDGNIGYHLSYTLSHES